MAFQRRMWLFQRVAWAVLSLLLIAALLGLFSQGPLSATTTQDPSGQLAIEHQRFERSDAATDFTIRVQPVSDSGTVALTYSPDFLRGFTITEALPAPVESRGGPEGLTHVFRSEGGPFSIHLSALPRDPGLVRSRIAIVGGPAVQLTQFIYP